MLSYFWPGKSSFKHATYLHTFLRYANHAARFIDSYAQGLSGPEAAWANKKYHGHCTLHMTALLKKSYKEYTDKLGAVNVAANAT